MTDTRAKITHAEQIVNAVKAVGFEAEAVENGLAVRVTNPNRNAVRRVTTVWLPLEGDNGEGYIWGSSFQHAAPTGIAPQRVAQLVKASSRYW